MRCRRATCCVLSCIVATCLTTVFLITLIPRRTPARFLRSADLHILNIENLVHHQRIPRLIHQTWRTTDIPERWNQTVQSVREANFGRFEYRLWTDDEMHQFVREKETKYYERTFRHYRLDIQRVDAFRYIILYYLGGVYIDMDNGCRQSFENLFKALELLDPESKHLCAFPQTSPIGVSNGFMIATPSHPLFDILRSRLTQFDYFYLVDYLTVMMSAGPLYLSFHEHFFDPISSQSSVRILDDIVYSSIFTWHTPGNSWHGRDARLILYIYHKIRQSSSRTVNGVIFFIGFLIVYRCFLRKRFSLSREFIRRSKPIL